MTTIRGTTAGRLLPTLGIALGMAALVAAVPNANWPAAARQPRTGQQVFATTCAACHQAQGEGTDVYPPLAGSEWVKGPEQRMLRIVIGGLQGDVDVQGQTYSGAMPAWGPTLSDAEIAAVATYVRASWGNAASPVTEATVKQIRAATASRTKPWTVPELMAVLPVEKH